MVATLRRFRFRRRRSIAAAGHDVHLFLVWPTAVPHAERILADIEERFCLHELIHVRWTPERFGENLGRFYGPLLPPGVDKLSETGIGDVLVVVVSDPAPRYRPRLRSVGWVPVNVNVFDAKQRYRAWTGGGHLVHATNDRAETERDLFFLFGRRVEDVAPSDCRKRPEPCIHAADLTGSGGWSSFDEVLTALRLSGGYVLLNPDEPAPPELLTRDAWSVEILKARPAGAGSRHEVSIGPRAVPVVVSWLGDGRLPRAWQRVLLRDAVARADGTLVPSVRDRFYLALHERLQRGEPPSADETVKIQELAERCGAPAGDYADAAFARATFESFVDAVRP